jgi:hypothetical protein
MNAPASVGESDHFYKNFNHLQFVLSECPAAAISIGCYRNVTGSGG